MQFAVAGALGLGLTIATHRWRLARAMPPAEPPLDVGHAVRVDTWRADGTARVTYRGAEWDAELAAPDVPRGETMYITAMRARCSCSRTAGPRHDRRATGDLHHVDRVVAVHDRPVRRRHHRHRQGDPRRAAAARAGDRAPRPLLRGAAARAQLRHSVRRSRRLPARPARDPVRRPQPDLHHQGQHPAAGRRHSLFPGHRPQARVVRVEQLPGRDHAAGADDAAQRHREDGTRSDVRGARPHQRASSSRRSTRRRRTGASRCSATRSRT